MAKKRIRTHANPLAYPQPLERTTWNTVLDEHKPLYVDLGCGQGQFIITSAKNHQERNYLGIEVRKSMAEKVSEEIAQESLTNVHCIRGNASISLRSLFKDQEVREFYINFPDPWIKPKHTKRRIIRDYVVIDLHAVLADDGVIYLLTDVKEIYDDFYALLQTKFIAYPYEEKAEKSYWQDWHIKQGNKLYASCFRKTIPLGRCLSSNQ